VDPGLSLGTARLLGLPIQDKGLPIVALSRLMSPAIGAEGGANHLALRLGLGRHQEVSIDRAAVEQMGAGPQITCGSIVHNCQSPDALRRGGRRRDALRYQIRLARITGRGAGHLLAHPVGLALTAVAGL
jgi:hypothetical protein